MTFWKTFGAAMLAVFVGCVTFFLIIFFLGAGLLASFSVEPEKVEPETVLYIDLAEDIVDAPRISPFNSLNAQTMSFVEPITILEAISAIELAQTDNNIKGICIRQDGEGIISATNIEELRSALTAFKLSGKFVVAYDDYYTQSEYYLASVADCVLLHPEGSLDWRGVGFTTTFFKGLIDKLQVDVEVFRPSTCKYKSAVEPYIMSKMSDANREQMLSLAEGIWNTIVEDVAASREIEATHLKSYAANLDVVLPEDAVSLNLVDGLAHENELYDIFAELGVKKNRDGDYNALSLGEYIAIAEQNMALSMSSGDYTAHSDNYPLLGIIYADGEIVDGDMYIDDYVYGTTLAAELRAARLDEQIKAVVVRINSPGGSALASDIIWNEMSLLQKSKPVVVSMASMAASGGYYISVPADYIVANRLTLTGSIGVFGVVFNLENTLKNKLGITFDEVGTSPTAGGMTIARQLTDKERNALNRSVDRVYDTFTNHVADGRNLTTEDVLAVAEGRVWSGRDAVENGLADLNGGFVEAIALAADLADLGEDFAIYEFLAPLTPLEEWIASLGTMFVKSSGLEWNTFSEDIISLIEKYPFLFTRSGVQCIVPYDIKLNI